MSLEPIFIDCNRSEKSVTNQIVNFYDTYVNALAFSSAGLLANIRAFDTLTFEAKGIISQTAKTAGPKVDVNGILIVAIDTGTTEAYLRSDGMGKWGGPRRIVIQDVGSDLNTQSTSSSSSREFETFSSSSTSSTAASVTSSSSSSVNSSSSSSSSSTINLSSSSNSSSSTSSEGTLSISSSSSSGLP